MLKARRYNKGKTRFSLVPPSILEALAKVYTLGAHKYSIYKSRNGDTIKGMDIPYNEVGKYEMIDDGANNWKNGMSVTETLDSAQRHIESFRKGESIDELGTHHLANAAWNCLAAMWTSTNKPTFDDRNLWWKDIPSVWLDIDGVLADFSTAFLKYFNFPNQDEALDWDDPRFRNNFAIIANDEDFWMSIPPLVTIEDIHFPFQGYCTHRPIPTRVVEAWLEKHGFPKKPVINVGDTSDDDTLIKRSKVEALKEAGCELFIDDGFHNFVELNNAGIPCYLMTRSHNKRFDVGNMRIDNINEVIKYFI